MNNSHPTPTAPDYADARLKVDEVITGMEKSVHDRLSASYFTLHELNTIRQALALAADPWNTNMDEAPRDGRDVVLYWGGSVIVGSYLDNSKTRAPWQGWKPPAMKVWPVGQPIAWMPLPAAPAERG